MRGAADAIEDLIIQLDFAEKVIDCKEKIIEVAERRFLAAECAIDKFSSVYLKQHIRSRESDRK